jgi:muconate cycloisomerase
MDPVITQVDLTPIFVPFKPIVQQFMSSGEGGVGMAIPVEEAWVGGDFVVCQVTCNDGSIGVGEVFMWLPETGVSPNQVIDSIQNGLGRYIIGESPFNVERMATRMNHNVARNEVAKGLLDMACYDLMGQLTGNPACEIMGGQVVEQIPLTALIPLTDVELMVALVKMYLKKGYRTFRIKLGRGIAEDAAIIEQIRAVIGSDSRLRVDYNQAYQPPDAVKAIQAIEVGVLGVNLERPGGITNALHLIDYANAKGFGTVLHNQPLGINSAAQAHLAAARFDALGHSIELTGDEMLEDDLILEPLVYEEGYVKLPQGPGWGVTLDEQAMDYYKTSLTITLKQK